MPPAFGDRIMRGRGGSALRTSKSVSRLEIQLEEQLQGRPLKTALLHAPSLSKPKGHGKKCFRCHRSQKLTHLPSLLQCSLQTGGFGGRAPSPSSRKNGCLSLKSPIQNSGEPKYSSLFLSQSEIEFIGKLDLNIKSLVRDPLLRNNPDADTQPYRKPVHGVWVHRRTAFEVTSQ